MIYFLAAVYLFILTLVYRNTNDNNQRKAIFLLAAIPFVLLFALRDKTVGGDTLEYVSVFFKHEYTDQEIGYSLFCDILSIFGNSPFVLIFGSSLISLVPFILLVYDQSKKNPLPLLLFFCSSVLIICVETHIRQNVGTGLMMLGYYIYEKKKDDKVSIIISLLLIIWGALCHNSLYFMAPLCVLIYFIHFNKRLAYILVVTSFIIGILSSSLMENFFNTIALLTEGVERLDRYNLYVNNSELGTFVESSFGVSSILSISWSLFYIHCLEKDDLNNYFVKCFIVYVIIHNIGNTSLLMYRLIYTLQLGSIVFIPPLFIKKEKFWIVLLFLFVYLRSLFRICTDTSLQNPDAMMFPYTFIF